MVEFRNNVEGSRAACGWMTDFSSDQQEGENGGLSLSLYIYIYIYNREMAIHMEQLRKRDIVCFIEGVIIQGCQSQKLERKDRSFVTAHLYHIHI